MLLEVFQAQSALCLPVWKIIYLLVQKILYDNKPTDLQGEHKQYKVVKSNDQSQYTREHASG